MDRDHGQSLPVTERFDLSETTSLNSQVSKGFRLGGINDPL